ncbi:MAG: hypothetical protein ABI574_10360 [Burkholderiales bacterium]
MTPTIQTASRTVRWLYAATLVGGLVVTRALWLQWPTMSGWFIGMGLVALCGVLLCLWRAIMVLRRRSTLDAPQARGGVLWLRRVGVVGMAAGALCLLASLALPWVLANWRAIATEHLGVVGFVVGLFVMLMSVWATGGLMLFEFSRLLAFEQAQRQTPPAAPPATPPGPNHVGWRPRAAARRANNPDSTEGHP